MIHKFEKKPKHQQHSHQRSEAQTSSTILTPSTEMISISHFMDLNCNMTACPTQFPHVFKNLAGTPGDQATDLPPVFPHST